MLTGPKCSALIEEQERKKKEEIELKSKRKAERERKKKEKEAAAKLKAEERMRRAEAKAKDGTRKRKAQTKICSNAKKPRTVSLTEDSSTQGSSIGSSIPIDINENECCVCFRTFQEDERDGNGLEWVKCACSRWMHEECITGMDVDAEGKELFCPFCAV